MSTGRYLLTGAVLLGGAVYYDQNVQPIFPAWVRQKEKEIPQTIQQQQQRISLEVSSKYDKEVKPRIEDLSSKVSSKASAVKNDVTSTAESVQDKFKLTKVYKETDEYLKKVDAEARRLAEDDSQKSYVRQGVINYINWVNDLAGASTEPAPGEVDVVFVEFQEPKQSWSEYLYDKSGLHYISDKVSLAFSDGKKELDAKGNELNAKATELGNKAEDAKNKAVDAISAKYAEAKKAADAQLDDVKSIANRKWNKASATVEDQKDKAINEYYKAKKDFDDLVAKGDAAKARDVETAKSKLNLAYASVKQASDNAVRSANEKLDKLK